MKEKVSTKKESKKILEIEKKKREEEVSLRAKILRDAIAAAGALPVVGDKFKNGEARIKRLSKEPPWQVPEGFILSKFQLTHCEAELLEPEVKEQDFILLQLHGGGYVEGMGNRYRTSAGLYSEVGKGMPVLTVDYRIAPENPYPAALLDAYEGYHFLIKMGYSPEHIIIAGDSAGGGLALALVMYLRDNKETMPAGIVTMSAWTDLTCKGESYQSNFEKDPMFGNSMNSLIYNCTYATKEEKSMPYVSPLYGHFQGFPPMLMQVGTYEMLLDDTIMAAKKAKEEGVKVKLSIYKGMFHVFQMAMLLLPESKKAWVEVGRFLDTIKKRVEKDS